MSRVTLHPSALVETHCRVVYTLAPGMLVRIGPDLDTALRDLVNSLLRDLTAAHGHAARHFATTYSLLTIAIMIDTFVESHQQDVDIKHPQLKRLRLANGKVVGQSFEQPALQDRVSAQLDKIFHFKPTLSVPFMCVEAWMGIGPPERPLYENMNKASSSVSAFRAFKASFPRPPPEEMKKASKIRGEPLGPEPLEVSSVRGHEV
ncbi:MAG: hypothetical protein M1837_001155 [Sclerophora amabilis]|nr:MAG: hypothetical protein M1837_001155 [Sclerophora amabilis]